MNEPPLILVHQLNESQTVQLWELYQQQWWSAGRSLADVREMLAATSLIFGLVDSLNGRLVGFCRVLTDFTFRGMLYDVIVDGTFRQQGLGRRLMEAVRDDPRLSRVQSISLWCKPELVPLYEKFGFAVASGECVWMERKKRDQ